MTFSYLDKEALDNLKYYKYGSVDKSPLSYYILQPYWSWAVQFFPLWMAPNLITLMGLGFVIINVVFIAIWMPDLKGPVAPWIYFSCALGVWLYSTFDNVDGKQARRTNSSSPLGELFDHGCDALNCSLGGLVQAAAMGLGSTWYSAYIPFMAVFAFYFSTWEEYYTGILYLGHINGPTEGLVIAVVIMTLSGIYGPGIWQLPLTTILPSQLHSYFPKHFTITDGLAWQMGILLFFMHVPTCIYSVYQACQQKKKSFSMAMLQTLPIIFYSVFGYLWLSAPSSIILKNHLLIFILTLGITFGRMASKIILAYVTRMPFPYFTIMQVPLLIGALLANAPEWFGRQLWTQQQEYYFLIAYFLFVLVAYLRWSLIVIDRFCKHLGIKCLTIPYPPPNMTKDQKKKK